MKFFDKALFEIQRRIDAEVSKPSQMRFALCTLFASYIGGFSFISLMSIVGILLLTSELVSPIDVSASSMLGIIVLISGTASLLIGLFGWWIGRTVFKIIQVNFKKGIHHLMFFFFIIPVMILTGDLVFFGEPFFKSYAINISAHVVCTVIITWVFSKKMAESFSKQDAEL